MLITFTCKAYADITMFGDIGLLMLEMMGRRDTMPGAMLGADIPEALSLLKRALAIKNNEMVSSVLDEDNDDVIEPIISLQIRALPLIKLLTAANEEKCNVMWESSGPYISATAEYV